MAKPAIHYLPLSGIRGINGCLHYLEIEGKKILLDAGLDPEDPAHTIGLVKESGIKPDAVIISHAHLDHMGALPEIILQSPHSRIYMTYPTIALVERMLVHHYKLTVRKSMEEWRKLQLSYTLDDLEQLFYLFQAFPLKKAFPIHHYFTENVQIRFFDAGHILGSAMVLVEYKKIKILYSGNFRLSPQSIMKGAEIPPGKVDILFLESTYGAENTENGNMDYQTEKKRFIRFINEKIRMDGSVLIPAFALGRTQEIIHLLTRELIQGNLYPLDIYVTGLGNAFTRIYDAHRRFWQKKSDRDLKISVKKLNQPGNLPRKAVIIATSGFMKEGTHSLEIARKIMNDPRCGIAFVGYVDPDSPGYQLRQKQLAQLREESWLLRGAEIQNFHFSAHASQHELLELVRQTQPSLVVLFHGDDDARTTLEEEIRSEFPLTHVFSPVEGNLYSLSDFI